MEGGGHFDWGQNIDSNNWRNIIKEFIRKFKNNYKLIFLAHNLKEFEQA